MNEKQIHIDFTLYSFTSIWGFSEQMKVVDTKSSMLWILTATNKCSTLCIIKSILTTTEREDISCKTIRIYEYDEFY